ncbi:MAG: ribonuclease E activity regulator RraA [Burkholderiaceae bacterium]|nr:ribonuclease E activity regulator RraA [Burkholderiaceae bacterium]
MSTTFPATTDLCDAHESRLADGSLRVLPPLFQRFGKRAGFYGPAVTLKVFEDNALVRSTLETPGAGQVLVIDGGASLRCALVGGQLGVLAEKNAWAGIVVNGCIRDSVEIDACDIGVRALALSPRRAAKKGVGERNVPVTIAESIVEPGNWIYVDADGILVSRVELAQ